MSREHPFKCPHGVYMGGHESFGCEDAVCSDCDRYQERLCRLCGDDAGGFVFAIKLEPVSICKTCAKTIVGQYINEWLRSA